jgi:hypothetical protein
MTSSPSKFLLDTFFPVSNQVETTAAKIPKPDILTTPYKALLLVRP